MARDLRYMETGVCAMCGKDVHIDDKEGRVVCDGCDRPTDNCTCISDNLDTRHESSSKTGAMREGTSASWIADDPDTAYDEELEDG